jgi:hypothetical protein
VAEPLRCVELRGGPHSLRVSSLPPYLAPCRRSEEEEQRRLTGSEEGRRLGLSRVQSCSAGLYHNPGPVPIHYYSHPG